MPGVRVRHFFLSLFVILNGIGVAPLDLKTSTKTGFQSLSKAELYKPAISLAKLSNSVNTFTGLLNIKLNSTRITEQSTVLKSYVPDLSQWNFNERSRIIIQSLHANHPLRERRDIQCTIPTETVQDMTRLYSSLNRAMFYGNFIKQSIPGNNSPAESMDCPNAESDEVKQICPAFQTYVYVGRSSVPSFIPMSVCRCNECLKYPGKYCEHVTVNVTYYDFTGCSLGLAILSKKVTSTSVGCVCAKRFNPQT